jgi:hypothetical protein
MVSPEVHRLKIFENRVLRMFEPERDEVTGGWRKFHDEELHNLYSSPCIIRTIKSRRMRWIGHVVSMGEMRDAFKIWPEKLEGKYHLEGLDVDERIC